MSANQRARIGPLLRAALVGVTFAALVALILAAMAESRPSAAFTLFTSPAPTLVSAFVSPLPTPAPSQPRRATPPDTSAKIAQPGGRLTSSEGQVTVTFSSGAVKEPVITTLSFNVPQAVPARLRLVGPVFVIKGPNLSNAPMTIAVRYLPPAGINERDLTLTYYDAAFDKWLPLPTTIDTANHTATAWTDQPARFALVWLGAAQPPSADAVIVDDQDAGFVRHGAGGGWHSVSGSNDYYYLGHMFWTSNTYSIEDNWATWTPTLVPGA